MRSVILVLLGACSYGVLSTFVKFAYDAGFTVDEVVGAQMLFGIAMIWPIALLFAPRNIQATLKQWIWLVVVGSTIGTTGMFYYASLQYIPASIAIVLLFQFTWIGVLLEAVLSRQMPGKSEWISILMLFIGTLLAGGVFDTGLSEVSAAGIVLGLLAAISYTVFIIFSGRTATSVHPLSRSAIMLTGSIVITFVVYPPVFVFNGALPQGLWGWGLLLGLFGLIIPTLFYNAGVPKIGGGLATILSAAELPTAILMSGLVLRENVGVLEWIGVVVIVLGIAVPELFRLYRLHHLKEEHQK